MYCSQFWRMEGRSRGAGVVRGGPYSGLQTPHCTSTRCKGQGSAQGVLYKGTNPNPNYEGPTPEAHLLVSPPWRLGIQHVQLGGTQTFRPQQDFHRLSSPLSATITLHRLILSLYFHKIRRPTHLKSAEAGWHSWQAQSEWIGLNGVVTTDLSVVL